MMDYLVYVAHDAENLQFYLWLKDYTKRFFELKMEERSLSPEWKTEANPFADEEVVSHKKNKSEIGFEKMQKPSYGSLRMSELNVGGENATMSDYQSFISNSVNSRKTVSESAEEAVNQAGLKWQPCKYLPFSSCRAGLTVSSYYSAIPRRDRQSYCTLLCSRISA
jgi:hypothetical protein